ncbi:hypothetical protein [Bdellovibrio svalbardensis]|uniref:Uncharacterized protein n=1 Tax=Bdellovibrio svalbardensis TaxID=2972972 RepID=A0ABT6DJC4_9BACT|nr:hypothetical protein [Bdellovibrio svalbardensis]MDG0816876.1 hypothetical protein [Bdellovibrio svalbardensis]
MKKSDRKIKLVALNSVLMFASAQVAHAMSTPEEIRDTTKSTMSTPKQAPSPKPKEKREIMPPPRKTPKPHNMEPPIAPMTDPQATKKLPPTEPPVPGADPRTDR